MFGYYTLYATNDDRFMFNLKAGNHEVILTSQVYGSRQSALAGIQSMRNNSQLESRYERRASNDGPAYFLLRANNGQIIAQSVMYTGLLALEKGIDSAISHGPSQNIEIHV